MRRIITAAVLAAAAMLFLAGPAAAQYSEWQNFTSGKQINCLVSDGTYLWVGTVGGLVRVKLSDKSTTFYDKVSTDLPANNVTGLALHGSTLWIATNGGGIASLTGTDTFTMYNTTNSGLPEDRVLSITVDGSGTVWAGTDGAGIASFNGSAWTVYNSTNAGFGSDIVWALAVTDDGKLWAGIEMAGLSIYSGGIWTHYDRYTSGLPNNVITSLWPNADNSCWMGTRYGAALFDGDATWTVYKRNDSGLPSNTVSSVAADGSGNVWFGTNLGLVLFDGDTTWTVFNVDVSDLPDNQVNALLPLGSSVWAGTDYGITEKDGSTWTEVNTSMSGLPENSIKSIVVDKEGNPWFGTNEYGLAVKKGSSWEIYNRDNSVMQVDQVNALIVDKDSAVWAGTGQISAFDGNLVRFKGSSVISWEAETSGLPGYNVMAFFIDSYDTLWIGTTGNDGSDPSDDGGVAKFVYPDTWITYNSYNSGLQKNEIPTIAEDIDGSMWFSMTEGYMDGGVGVARFDREDTTWTIYQKAISDLPDDYVPAVVIDSDGNKWFATWSGLAKLSGDTWTIYKAADGHIPSDKIITLALDAAENLWIGTEEGLVKFDRTDTWTLFTVANSGLASNNIQTIYVDEDDNKWIGTAGGASVCNTCAGGTGIHREPRPFTEPGAAAGAAPVYPNPFLHTVTIPLQGIMSGPVTVRIHMPDGTPVTAFTRSVAGTAAIVWDGTDDHGRQVDAGLYLCTVSAAGGETYTSRLIRTR